MLSKSIEQHMHVCVKTLEHLAWCCLNIPVQFFHVCCRKAPAHRITSLYRKEYLACTGSTNRARVMWHSLRHVLGQVGGDLNGPWGVPTGQGDANGPEGYQGARGIPRGQGLAHVSYFHNSASASFSQLHPPLQRHQGCLRNLHALPCAFILGIAT